MAHPPKPRAARRQAAPARDLDPVTAAHLERALAPYRGVLPPDALAELEELLLGVLLTHPEVAPVANRLRPRRPPQKSGPRPAGGEGGL
jgi:hypothetical protein